VLSVVIGVVLLVSGLAGLAFAWGAHHHRGWSLLSAAVAVLVGVLILFRPSIAALGLTLLLGAYLLVDGVVMIALAMNHRARETGRWAWLAASGVIDLVLAAFLLLLGATGAATLVGVVVGVDLIAAGIGLLMLRHTALGGDGRVLVA
jgi:uncharacterized membrane protein HdeD (DUF308 family)